MSYDPYDHEPTSNSSGGYLKMSKKGDKISIRIASEPYIRLKIWDDTTKKFMDAEEVSALSSDEVQDIKDTVDMKVSAEYTWVVIDRDSKEAMVYSASTSIFSKVKQLAKNSKWGDVTMYDIDIERTEKSPAEYYVVTPDPTKKKMTATEIELADAVDVEKMVKGSMSLKAFMEREAVRNTMGGGETEDMTDEEKEMIG